MNAVSETPSSRTNLDTPCPHLSLRQHTPATLVKAILEARAIDLRITPEVETRIDRDSDTAAALMALIAQLHRIAEDDCAGSEETAGRLLSTLTYLRHTLHVRFHAAVTHDPQTASGQRLDLLQSICPVADRARDLSESRV